MHMCYIAIAAIKSIHTPTTYYTTMRVVFSSMH